MLPQNCGIVAVELRRPKVYKNHQHIFNTIQYTSGWQMILQFTSTYLHSLHNLGHVFTENLSALLIVEGILWPKFDHSKTGAESGVNIWTGPWPQISESGPHKDNDDNVKLGISQHFLLCHERRQFPCEPLEHWRRHVVMLLIIRYHFFGSTPALFTHPLWLIWPLYSPSQQPAILRTLEAEVERLI